MRNKLLNCEIDVCSYENKCIVREFFFKEEEENKVGMILCYFFIYYLVWKFKFLVFKD